MGHVSGSIGGLSPRALDGSLAQRGFAPPTVRQLSAANLARWTAARGRALAMGELARIALIGDSTQGLVGSGGGGTFTENGQPASLAAQLVTLLNARAGRPSFARSDGYWGNHFSTAGNLASFLAYDQRWTVTGNLTQDTVAVAGGSLAAPASGTGRQLAFAAPPLSYDRVRLIHARGSGFGTLTVAGAGGGSQQIPTAGSAGNVATVVSLTRGAGPLTIAFSDNAYARLISVELWDSTVGQVIVRDMAYSGSTTNSYGQSASAMPLLASDMALYCFGLNDAAAGTTPESFATQLTTLIAGYSPAGSVALTVPNESSPAWHATATLEAQRAIAAQIRALGVTAGYPVIDMPARWGDYAAANANGLHANDPHPNGSGYADKAVALMQLLWA